MRLFDTHAHIGLIDRDPVRQISVIQQAKQAGVLKILSINNSLQDFKTEYSLLKIQKNVYHAVGVAPAEATSPGKDWVKTIEESAKLPGIVAVGETGLDYQYGDKRAQTEVFLTQLDLAESLGLPVIVHNRNAGADVFELLKEHMPSRGAILHCYSENAEYANRCLDAGLDVYFSFAGNLTYRNARNLHETALNIPIERMMLETESPFMVPSQYLKFKRTMPAYLTATARFLAELLEQDLDSLTETIWNTSCKVFNISAE